MEPSLFLREADLSKVRVVGTPPYGFKAPAEKGAAQRPAAYGTAGGAAASAVKRKTSSDGRWQLGDRVFNDDRGYGEITAIEEGEDGPVITVRYENGRIQRFLSRAHSSRFMKIRD
jgi:DNA helicase-2/ATP-dependent DNA helicase PcrA